MTQHAFIFQPGEWLGEGKVTLSVSPDEFHFYAKWKIEKSESGLIYCKQFVEIEGGGEQVINCLQIFNVTPQSFEVTLYNDVIEATNGAGIIDAKKIAWEFHTPTSKESQVKSQSFEGFEVYDLQEGGDYISHAEYISSGHLRTTVTGRIWKKSDS